MGKLLSHIKKLSLLITSIISGICLFLLVFSIICINTIMSGDYHKNLFKANNIQTHIKELVDNSKQDLLDIVVNNSQSVPLDKKEILNIIQNFTSEEMITNNVNSLRDGIFEYFNNSKKFLPYIYFDNKKNEISKGKNTPTLSHLKKESDLTKAGSLLEEDKSTVEGKSADKKSESAKILEKIERINLNTILTSINGSMIIEFFLAVKFAFYIIYQLPFYSILIVLFLLSISFILCRNIKEIIKWVNMSLLVSGTLMLIMSFTIISYFYFVINPSINNMNNTIKLDTNVIKNYLESCITPLSILLMISGLLINLFVISNIYLPESISRGITLPGIFSYFINRNKDKIIFSRKIKYTLKYAIVIFLIMFSVIGFTIKTNAVRKDFSINNFYNVLSKLAYPDAVTQVISAKDDTIYTLNLKLLDALTQEGIDGVKVNVNGKSEIPNKYFNVNGTSDHSGSIKFTLGKGNYFITFLSSASKYYFLPSPFEFELKSVGATILTFNLHSQKILEPPVGIGEILVLDDENSPVEGVKIRIEYKKSEELSQSQSGTPSDNTLQTWTSIPSINEDPSEDNLPIDNKKPSGTTSLYMSDEDSLAMIKEESLNKQEVFSITNKEGIGIFKLDKGVYKVSFINENFPEDYILPNPFDMEISSDVTTRYTLKLSKNE